MLNCRPYENHRAAFCDPSICSTINITAVIPALRTVDASLMLMMLMHYPPPNLWLSLFVLLRIFSNVSHTAFRINNND